MAEVRIKTPDGNNHVGLATANLSGDVTVTLPKASIDLSSAGTDGQFLKTNGAGTLSFADVSAGTALTGSTDNTVCTVTGANAIQGEANLKFDGTELTLAANRSNTAGTGHISIAPGDTTSIWTIRHDSTGNDLWFDRGTDASSTAYVGFSHDGNIKLTNGKGIDFAATAGPTNATGSTGTSELFSDYEEGTWTPVFSGASNLGSYSHQDGYYIKVGRVCHAWYYVRVDRGTSTSNAKVFGLPFDADHESVIWPTRHAYGGTAVHNIWGECQNNGDWIRFFRQDGTLTDTTNYYWDFGYANANSYVALSGTITYRTD